MKRILVTAPPFVRARDNFQSLFSNLNFEVVWISGEQYLTESELLELLPEFDGWILGDDPCTKEVLTKGFSGRLRAVVKWGVGTDNIDFDAMRELGIEFSNTPNAFGEEVADLAMAYLIMMARNLVPIHLGVLNGQWPKLTGLSLSGKKIGVVGFGDIGKNLSIRLIAAGCDVHVYESNIGVRNRSTLEVTFVDWPHSLEKLDALILCCSLNFSNRGMIDRSVFDRLPEGAFLVNVARGPLVVEPDLYDALLSGKLRGAALDVYEIEPLPAESKLRNCPNVIFGSHNASNTQDAVSRVSEKTVHIMSQLLTKT